MGKEKGSGFSFLKGAVMGAIAGATAGILFAPKSGEETRKDIKRKAEDLKASADELYTTAKGRLDTKISEIKDVSKDLDKTKYKALVDEVVEELKSDREVTKSAAKKLGKQLRDDWTKVKSAVK